MLTLTNKLCLLRWEHEHLHSSVVIIQCKTGYISFLEPKAGAVINSYRILALSEATHYIMIKHRRSFEITCTYDHYHKWPSPPITTELVTLTGPILAENKKVITNTMITNRRLYVQSDG